MAASSAYRPRVDWAAVGAIGAAHAGILALLLTTGVVVVESPPVRPIAVESVPLAPEPAAAVAPPELSLEPVVTEMVAPEVIVETPPPATPALTTFPTPPPAPAALPSAAPAPAPAAAPAPPAPITPPDYSAAQLANPGPRYPTLSRRNREQGVVMLKVLVTPEGKVGELQVEKSSGFERLDEAALDTVRKWRFLPARQAGQPVLAWVLVPITFALSG